MNAVLVREFGGPEVLRVEDVPVPQPGESQVRVRVHAAGVNPVESYIRSGAYARKPALPYVPGTDAAGVVDAIGPGGDERLAGTRVYVSATLAKAATGTYAEFVACEAAHVHPLPAAVGFAQGAAIGVPYITAYRALFQKAGLRAAETVLVHGASGMVGLAAVQFARAAGAQVAATAGSERGFQLVVGQGAHHVEDHRSPDHLAGVLAWTGGRGVDVIVEMLANVNLERDFTALAPFGRIVVVGSRGTLEFTPRLVMGKDATIAGMTAFNIPPQDLRGIYAAIGAGLETGVVRPVVGREFPLADASRAHEALFEPGAHGKIVLIP